MKRNVLIFAFIIGLAVSACGRKTVEQNTADIKISEDVDFIFSENNGMITITRYTGVVKDVKIPETINGLPVVAIGDRAFANNQLISVTIPDSVTSIGWGAFWGCISLTSINVVASNNTFSTQDGILYNKNKTVLHTYPAGKTNTSFTVPDSVTSIGDSAFDDCTSLTSVTIPNSVTIIGSSAFRGCKSLTSVTIPDSVASIGHCAFDDCTSLTSVNIPDSVVSIGEKAFTCFNLTAINVDKGNTEYSSKDGVLYNKDKSTLIQWPAKKNPVSIPSTVTYIGRNAFYGNRFTSIIIPDSVLYIGMRAFADNQLTSVTIGAHVTIEIEAFSAMLENLSYRFGGEVYISSGFETAYNDSGRQAGIYTRPDVSSTTWAREAGPSLKILLAGVEVGAPRLTPELRSIDQRWLR